MKGGVRCGQTHRLYHSAPKLFESELIFTQKQSRNSKKALPEKAVNYSVAIGFVLLSTCSFALMSAMVRLSGALPTMQKVFFRNSIAVFVAIFMIAKSREKISVQKRNWLFLAIRAAAGTIGLIASYYTYDVMLISDATMLAKLAPFSTILFSALIMREKVTPAQLTALAVVFAGSLLVIKPSFDFSAMLPAIIAAAGGIIAGVSITMVRFLQLRGEKSESIVLAFSLTSCIVCLPQLIFGYVPMTAFQLLSLIAAGICATIGQFSMSAAYKRAPAGVLSVFEYSQVLFSALFGMMLFSQKPDILSVIGYIVVVIASVIMAVGQRQKHI